MFARERRCRMASVRKARNAMNAPQMRCRPLAARSLMSFDVHAAAAAFRLLCRCFHAAAARIMLPRNACVPRERNECASAARGVRNAPRHADET